MTTLEETEVDKTLGSYLGLVQWIDSWANSWPEYKIGFPQFSGMESQLKRWNKIFSIIVEKQNPTAGKDTSTNTNDLYQDICQMLMSVM